MWVQSQSLQENNYIWANVVLGKQINKHLYTVRTLKALHISSDGLNARLRIYDSLCKRFRFYLWSRFYSLGKQLFRLSQKITKHQNPNCDFRSAVYRMDYSTSENVFSIIICKLLVSLNIRKELSLMVYWTFRDYEFIIGVLFI